MTNVFISLFPDPPKGFEYRKPNKRDLRGSRVAILCHSLEDALSLTENFTEYVYGLVITEGEKFCHSSIGPELWHLVIPHVMIPGLHKIVSIFFDIMANGQEARDENSSLKIELSLSRKIQKQTQSSYNQSTGRLINKVSEIRHIIDYAQFGVFRTDVMGRIFLANPALIKIFGYTSLEAMNKVGLQNIYQRKSDRDQLLSLVKQGSSRQQEPPLLALSEPDMKVSLHPALIVQPAHRVLSSERTDLVLCAQCDLTTVPLSGDVL